MSPPAPWRALRVASPTGTASRAAGPAAYGGQAGCRRAAQGQQQIALPARQPRRAVGHGGDVAVVVADGEEGEAAVAEAELVARPQPRLAPDGLAVDERAVGRAEVADAEPGRVPLDHGVE